MADSVDKSSAPLAGLRVLDLTRILAGPFATMILGDLGAEIIKVERPGSGDESRHWGPPFHDGVATYYESINRNKRSVTLDLKSAEGREIIWELIDTADVMLSNFRPGVIDRLGFAYETVAARRPQLVYGVVSGYGESGDGDVRSSFDLVIQAQSGLMDLTGDREGPPTKVGISIADEVAGLYLVQGVQSALLARQRTGRGQRVEVALHDAMLSMFTFQAQQFLSGGHEPSRLGNSHPSLAPYRPFEASDGTLIVGVASDVLWQRFCEAVGLSDLGTDDRLATNAGRVKHRDELEAAIAARLSEQPTAHWIEVLERAAVPCGRVRTAAEALTEEITNGGRMVTRCPGSDLRVLGVPVRLSDTPGAVRAAPPALGEHTEEVLAELGYEPREIAAMRERGVI